MKESGYRNVDYEVKMVFNFGYISRSWFKYYNVMVLTFFNFYFLKRNDLDKQRKKIFLTEKCLFLKIKHWFVLCVLKICFYLYVTHTFIVAIWKIIIDAFLFQNQFKFKRLLKCFSCEKYLLEANIEDHVKTKQHRHSQNVRYLYFFYKIL